MIPSNANPAARDKTTATDIVKAKNRAPVTQREVMKYADILYPSSFLSTRKKKNTNTQGMFLPPES